MALRMSVFSNRDRSIVMLTSPDRLYPVLYFKVPEWLLVLLADSFL
jgi:hypothetical protein